MITRASKWFFGLAAFSWLAGLIYGITTNGLGGVVETAGSVGSVDALLGPLTFGYKGGVGDHFGYATLMGAAAISLVLGVITSAFRDADVEAVAELGDAESIPPVSEPSSLSPWPIAAAVGATLAVVGLATEPVIFMLGAVILGLVTIEWTVSAWADRATGDATLNAEIRNRMMNPIELPLAGLATALAIAFCVSRIFLASSVNGAVAIASLLLVLFLAGGVAIGSLPHVRRAIVLGVLVAGVVIVIAVGIIGGVMGPREFEHHEDEGHALVDSASVVTLRETH